MALFQSTVVQKYINAQDKNVLERKWEAYKAHFHNTSIQENIRNAKEEQYQGEFLIDLFVNVLGYTKNPSPDFNLTTELKNVKDAKKADGGILVNDKVVGVIELKGTDTTDLSKVETQAFGYKNNQKNCTYVITSNFEKLRFYIDNAIEHQAFDLFQLTENDFKLLYLCLAYENISKDIPKKLKNESLSQEDVITKQLYKDYSLFKRELFNNLTELNPDIDPIVLFKKSQKLLDRFLFLFFAEDRHLLPPNSVRLVLKQWKQLKELDAYSPLYSRYKKYFGYLNTGHKGKKYDVYPYNGGLFKPDDILDNVKIDDDLLYIHTLKLSEYDFDSEVDVNILGHIFENSLNEIEEIQTQLEEDPNAKPKVSKRKKDGVFYTPKYITKYIVENTVGKLCEEQKQLFKIIEEKYTFKRQKKTKETLLEKLKTYRQWLLKLTICDPACGSGAFLNEALNFLIAEHQYIDELEAKLMGGGFVFPNVENSILENNLYGVDINNESVEIAKLSLWLRTAQPNRKLNDLSHNIKCGNSLIDDPEVAGDKAFKWEREFSQVFKEKDKRVYHITTALHDSRTSKRMIDYKVREKRDGGTNPYPNYEKLTAEEEVLITEEVLHIVKEDKLQILAFNVCADHMHLLLVCEEEDIPKIMQKIKAKTARKVNIHKGITIPSTKEQASNHIPTKEHASNHIPTKEHAPLPSQKRKEEHAPYPQRGKKQNSLWTQKYGCKPITDETQLNNTINYIQHNRGKHHLPESQTLNKLIDEICCTADVAFAPEYKGGFDVVIGNPPYGSKLDNKDWLKEKFENTSHGTIDSYKYFVQLGTEILHSEGVLGYIMPDSYLEKEYFKDLRLFVTSNFKIVKNIKLGDDVFNDVNLPTAISILLNKGYDTEIFGFKDISDLNLDKKTLLLQDEDNYIHEKPDSKKSFIIYKSIISERVKTTPLIKIFDQVMGVKVYQRGKGKPKQTGYEKNNDVFVSIKKDDSFNYPYVSQGIERYNYEDQGEFISYGEWLAEPRKPYYFDEPKVVIREIINPRIFATHIDYPAVVKNIAAVIVKKDENYSLLYLLALINSKLFTYYVNEKSPKSSNKSYPSFNSKLLKGLPIKVLASDAQEPVAQNAKEMLFLIKKFRKAVNKFSRSLQREFPEELEKLPKKLQDWYELSFADFVKELKKKKIKLSLSQKAEWEDYFLAEQQKALDLQAQINATDKEIDQMVYELYGLTEEEIEVVESN